MESKDFSVRNSAHTEDAHKRLVARRLEYDISLIKRAISIFHANREMENATPRSSLRNRIQAIIDEDLHELNNVAAAQNAPEDSDIEKVLGYMTQVRHSGLFHDQGGSQNGLFGIEDAERIKADLEKLYAGIKS